MMLAPTKELDIYGVFVPAVLVWATSSIILVKICHYFLARQGFYKSDLEQQTFDIALFIGFTSLLSFCI